MKPHELFDTKKRESASELKMIKIQTQPRTKQPKSHWNNEEDHNLKINLKRLLKERKNIIEDVHFKDNLSNKMFYRT